ncbi:MAG: hypothetical protein K9J85_07580, partial [Desulfobacteraceae bacterium]|nr:hypothetical protein [Desulfobacteraceae bacterium]
PDRFRDSSNAFAKISKTRPAGLKQFEIFTLRHLLNYSQKRSMSLQKLPPTLDFLGSPISALRAITQNFTYG